MEVPLLPLTLSLYYYCSFLLWIQYVHPCSKSNMVKSIFLWNLYSHSFLIILKYKILSYYFYHSKSKTIKRNCFQIVFWFRTIKWIHDQIIICIYKTHWFHFSIFMIDSDLSISECHYLVWFPISSELRIIEW